METGAQFQFARKDRIVRGLESTYCGPMSHATIFASAPPGTPAAMLSTHEETFWDAAYWDAVCNRDQRMDGAFYFAVLTTGVYCRPSCHARRPLRANVVFFRERDAAERAGFRACKRCRPQQVTGRDPQVEMVEKVCRYIESHLDDRVTLGALSRELGLSPFHLQRTFKELTSVTPRAYAETCRVQQVKRNLRGGGDVTRAMYEAGYGSSRALYEHAGAQLGMTPGTYRKQGAGMTIRYSMADSPAGKLLVASTDRGVCSVQFGESDEALRAGLRSEFAAAELREERPNKAVHALLAHLKGQPLTNDLPLDIQATAFQRRVWEHLRSIPYGRTESYAEVAKAIGSPTAARAVARACATNPAAIAIPCHRVVPKTGGEGGYRWGAGRKKKLLERERSAANSSA